MIQDVLEFEAMVFEATEAIVLRFMTDYNSDRLDKDQLVNKMIGIFELRLFINKMKASQGEENGTDGDTR